MRVNLNDSAHISVSRRVLAKFNFAQYSIVFLFAATGLTDNCTTSTTVHNRFIQFFTKFQQFDNITVSIIMLISTVQSNITNAN